jgi:hypothetical protein
MFLRNKQTYDDPTTRALMNKGIYSVQYPEEKESRWWIAWKEHNILSGMWYVFVLSCLLWWLPVFGQMIAGYVGGRRAGSPTKGLLVAVIPMFIIMFLLIAMDMGFLPFLVSIASIPSMIVSGLHNVSPQAASYISGIFEGLRPLVGLNGNGFLIVVVFGIIGGMMADMNKKEILRASGNGNMFDSIFGRMSGASLSKFADMVAERLFWTMATMEMGGRYLLPARHSSPREMDFEDLQMLPAHTGSYSSTESTYIEPVSYQPERAFGYEDRYPDESGFDEYENLAVEKVPVDYQEPEQKRAPNYDDLGIRHYDLSEESMTKTWIEQEKNLKSKKPRKRYGKTTNNRSKRLNDYDKKKPQASKEKRDATVFDGRGKVIKDGVTKSKKKKSQSNPESSLVARAMATDKKISARQESEPEELEVAPIEENLNQQEAKPRVKPNTSYERL